jgi:hypothetical protein
MANFPALDPAVRNYESGVFPVTIESGFNGGNVRFTHGSVKHGIELSLGYSALTEDNAALIRDHYRLQNGGHQSFLLPAIVYPVSGFRWKYESEPEEIHLLNGRIDVTVTLVSVRF